MSRLADAVAEYRAAEEACRAAHAEHGLATLRLAAAEKEVGDLDSKVDDANDRLDAARRALGDAALERDP